MKCHLDTDALKRFCAVNEDILKHIPEAKSEALKAMAAAAHEELNRQIDRRLSDGRGKVKGWQEVKMGSEGGYSRVGAKSEPVTNKYGKYYGYNSAQVTAFLERGHAVRGPSGKDPKYRPRLAESTVLTRHGGVVPGRLFYSWAKDASMELALEAAYKVMDKLADDYFELLYELS